MAIENPISAYNGESNLDAQMAKLFLESEGIEAFAIDDLSLVGYWMFGFLPEIHKPQVWVSKKDEQEAGRLLAIYESRKRERNAVRATKEDETVHVVCEKCEMSSSFVGSLEGTIQDCPNCGAYLDVGEFDWPFEDTDTVVD